MSIYVLLFKEPNFKKYWDRYRVPLLSVLFSKSTYYRTVGTFLKKDLYRYRRYFKSTECSPLFLTSWFHQRVFFLTIPRHSKHFFPTHLASFQVCS